MKDPRDLGLAPKSPAAEAHVRHAPGHGEAAARLRSQLLQHALGPEVHLVPAGHEDERLCEARGVSSHEARLRQHGAHGLGLQHQRLPVQSCAQRIGEAEREAEEDDPAPERTMWFTHSWGKMSPDSQ